MAGKKSIPQPRGQVSQETRKIIVYILSGLCLWSVLQLLFAHIDIPALWGLANFYYLPPTLSIALGCLSFAGAAAGFLTSSHAKRTTQGVVARPRTGTWVAGLFVVIVLGIVFLEVQVAWPFLGDGTSYMGMLYNFRESGTITTQRTATPSLYILYGIYYLYLKITGATFDSFFPFTFLGFASGIIFVVTALRFAADVTRQRWQQILFFILLLSLAGSLFFFGYVEMYSLQYACVFVYAYVGYRYLGNRATLLTVGLVLAATILLHLQNLLLAPSFILLVTGRQSGDRIPEDTWKTARRIILFTLPVLAIGYILTQTVLLDLLTDAVGSPFIPFSAEGDARYTLLSGRHLLDLLNYHLLIAAIPLVIIVACIAGGFAKIDRRDPYLLFLIVNTFFFETFLLGGGFSFGLARDWDVCASLGIFLALLSLTCIRQCVGSQVRVVIPIVIVSMCSALAWVVVNTNIRSSAARYANLLELYAPVVEKKITSRGYENLRKYQQQADVSSQLATIRRMLELYPTPADARQGMVAVSNQRQLTDDATQEVLRIVDIIEDQSDSLLVQSQFDKVSLGDPHAEMASTLGDFFEEFVIFLHKPGAALTVSEALQRCQQFTAKHPTLPQGYETYGYLVTVYTQQPSEAIAPLERAIACDSLRSRPYFYLGDALQRAGRRAESIAKFRQGLKNDPASTWGLVEYGKCLTKQPPTQEEVPYLHELKAYLTTALARPARSSLGVDQHREEQAVLSNVLERVERQLVEILKT